MAYPVGDLSNVIAQESCLLNVRERKGNGLCGRIGRQSRGLAVTAIGNIVALFIALFVIAWPGYAGGSQDSGGRQTRSDALPDDRESEVLGRRGLDVRWRIDWQGLVVCGLVGGCRGLPRVVQRLLVRMHLLKALMPGRWSEMRVLVHDRAGQGPGQMDLELWQFFLGPASLAECAARAVGLGHRPGPQRRAFSRRGPIAVDQQDRGAGGRSTGGRRHRRGGRIRRVGRVGGCVRIELDCPSCHAQPSAQIIVRQRADRAHGGTAYTSSHGS